MARIDAHLDLNYLVGSSDMALPPHNTHQAEHLRRVLGGLAENSFFIANVPMWDKQTEDPYANHCEDNTVL